MRRKLWLLDLFLLIAVVITGFVLKQRQSETTGREQALLKQAVPAPPAPALPGMPRVNPVTPATYMAAVQMNLFSQGSQSERDSRPAAAASSSSADAAFTGGVWGDGSWAPVPLRFWRRSRGQRIEATGRERRSARSRLWR